MASTVGNERVRQLTYSKPCYFHIVKFSHRSTHLLIRTLEYLHTNMITQSLGFQKSHVPNQKYSFEVWLLG